MALASHVEAARDELGALRESSASDSLRSQRQREETRRVSATLAETQQKVLALSRALEQAELAMKTSASEHASAMERRNEENSRALATATRAAAESEAVAVRAKEEEVISAKRAGEQRIEELEAALESERGRARALTASVAAAEERARTHAAVVNCIIAYRTTDLQVSSKSSCHANAPCGLCILVSLSQHSEVSRLHLDRRVGE